MPPDNPQQAGPLDTTLGRETPEGIALELRPAGLPARACAFLMDLLIRMLALYVVSLVTTLFGELRTAFMFIVFFCWSGCIRWPSSWGAAAPRRASRRWD